MGKEGLTVRWLALSFLGLIMAGLLAACGADVSLPPTATTVVTQPPPPAATATSVPPSATTAPTPLPPTITPLPATPTPTSNNRLTNSRLTLPLPAAPFPSATATTTRPNLSEHEGVMATVFKADVKAVQATAAPIYNIAATVQIESDTPQLAGREQLFYTNDSGQAQDSLYLWLYPNGAAKPTDEPPMVFSNLKVNGQPTTGMVENNRASLQVRFERPLPPGAQAVIELDFALDLGLSRGDHDFAKWSATDQVLSLNYWYPQLALFDPAIGGWDVHPYASQGDTTNSRVSFFNLWLTAPASLVVAPNGRIMGSTLNADGATKTTRVVTGPVRDCVAAFSPRYQEVSQTVGETKVTVYLLERDKGYAAKALQYSANALRTYSEAFGTYPYAEYRVAEAPLAFWGGLEFPALIYITTKYFNPASDVSLEFALAHEAAHQWFYGLIGNDQYRHAWMDEALAQYVTLLYYEKYRSATIAQGILNIYLQTGYNAVVTAGRDGVVDQPVDSFKEGEYAALVYNKGGLFYDAYRRQFGEAAFLKFARFYYQNNRYKYASPDDILKALKAGVELSQVQAVVELHRKWILNS